MKTAKRLESINEYYFSQKLREIETMNKQGANVINLGIGSPDLAPSPEVINELQKESSRADVHAYQSYKGASVLREAIADWYKVWYDVTLDPATEILPLLGSKEGIMHICMTYLDEGEEALVPNPGYPTYRSAVQLAGGVVREYELRQANHWMPDFEELEKQDLIESEIDVGELPAHAYGGQLPTQELFERIVAFGKKHQILICHDNPYSFILNDEPMSSLRIEGSKEVVVELNSLSKSHNMAGWRVGMLCGAKERIDEVLRFKSNMDSGMFLPVQIAAAKGLMLDEDWHDALNKVYEQRRVKVFELLDVLRCTYATSQAGMFVWAKIPNTFKTGFELSDRILKEANVFITPGGIFGSAGEQYIRVSLCSPSEKFGEAITRISKR